VTRLRMPMAKARLPEKLVQSQIVNLLRSIGAAVYTLGTTRRRGDYAGTCQTAGIGDIFCLMPKPKEGDGRACGLWVEVKAAGGRLRPEQDEFRKQCIAAGIPHVVGGVDELIAWLIAGGWLKRESVAHYREPKGRSE
jgi:hypothetical protein